MDKERQREYLLDEILASGVNLLCPFHCPACWLQVLNDPLREQWLWQTPLKNVTILLSV